MKYKKHICELETMLYCCVVAKKYAATTGADKKKSGGDKKEKKPEPKQEKKEAKPAPAAEAVSIFLLLRHYAFFYSICLLKWRSYDSLCNTLLLVVKEHKPSLGSAFLLLTSCLLSLMSSPLYFLRLLNSSPCF